MRKGLFCLALGVTVVLLPVPVAAQDHGGDHGGGCGDVFGDLIHILRDQSTGQPILQKRWVELPGEVAGYGWGYCPVAVDASGAELGFAPLSCDVAEEDLGHVVEVDYFGRLNGGRTKERNNRMHFNEVLSSIKEAGLVKQGPAGRLTLGYECTVNGGGQVNCAEWATVDSPMESLGLFNRLMKYGHFQTNPMQPDEWHQGDPKLPQQYHPALGPEDYAKFHPSVRHLLPNDGSGDPWACFFDANDNAVWDPTEPYTDLEEGEPNEYDVGEPFMDINANGVRDDGGDTFLCSDDGPDPTAPRHDVSREYLDTEDFARAGVFLGAAANKFGRSTRDLAQYFNRIMKVTKNTPHTLSTLATLPARVRVCTIVGEVPSSDLPDEEQFEPAYDVTDCDEIDAPVWEDPDQVFPDLHERFVDFNAAEYERLDWRNEMLEVIQPGSADGSWEEGQAYLMDWLAYVNGPAVSQENIDAFVEATGDTIRSIQFIHNYRIPEHLWSTEP